MKRLLIFIQFLFALCIGCFAQQRTQTVEKVESGREKLVQQPADVYKIEQHKNLFIGKPLSVLLNEIQPPIKRVMAQPSVNINSNVGYFIFNFIDNPKKDSLRSKGIIPETLVVYVKEYFDWDFQKRPTGRQLEWTSEDVKMYENLTIVAFRVYGDTTNVN